MAKKQQKKTAKGGKKSLCDKCTGLCCRYFALPIDTPEDWDDYDDIRWYLNHEDITVFVEDGDWYVQVANKCKYLSEDDYKCQMYETRPKICRGYSTENCDFTSDDYDYELHFTDEHQMEEYMKIKFGPKVFDKLNPRKRKKKAKKRKAR
ncbi:Flagellin N-methylase [Anaerohalosphaera lusitana]|uniref:Flagellin N-methylase n=1 Tax=Anaerohalosphaera lusitana TaxID=1936003 RepID=A0A1U9NN52_9BACT|nr:YkgJ family cysteine cluster protein [Anaerohalosphaera lusitana]AQT69040.1 Flagellin N-methylase [Anaerohalosphaera lusitana]